MAFTDTSNLRIPPLGRRLRLGFVGGGRGGLVGNWHFAGARLSNHWDIVAGALSSRPENAAASARDWCIAPGRSYTDYRLMADQEAARQDGIEAVAICTPNASHAEIAATFLRAGIDVILDKPMTTTVEDAHRLVALQRETGVSLTMTYPFSQHVMVRQAQALIAAGEIGKVQQVQVEYLQDWNIAPQSEEGAPWRQDPLQVGPSMIVGDIGTHAYHLLHVMTGLDVAELRADMFVCGGAKPQPDTAHINLRLTNGAPALMHLSNATLGQYCALRIRVWGEKGTLEWDQEKPEHLRFTPRDEAERIFIRGSGQGIRAEAQHVAHLPRGHGEALTDAWANLYAEAGLKVAMRRGGAMIDAASLLNLPGPDDGLKGMLFTQACADSWREGGIWTSLA
ncbi:Gfo/Idh/MocA family protein [Gemmobacter caeruleus]|uniref:Gfo/Idh/MocA family protein n=1 Tax=Gemmobacter caeruleus TaxID=2595004 RepID=UPI0011EE001D|nr:Gfo/Idh/MocA family oxidoreductase [Gemmobacter caeruleus]